MRLHGVAGVPSLRSRVAAIVVPVGSPASALDMPIGAEALAGAQFVDAEASGVEDEEFGSGEGSDSLSIHRDARPLGPIQPEPQPVAPTAVGSSRASRLGRSFSDMVAASACSVGAGEPETLRMMKAELQEYNGLLAMDPPRRRSTALERLKSL
mmetsp:Transcript_129091/g.321854  ORF Transcript_129091/g.321854 Transcript_129091/m.321854 type:complete len:154 (+) Transcript_129091:3-464(+)